MSYTVLHIDMDKGCAECGKKGATQSGICLKCVVALLGGKLAKSQAGKEVKERMKQIIQKCPREG